MSAIIALPIGGFVGSRVMTLLLDVASQASENLFTGLVAAVVAFVASWAVVSLGSPVFSDKEQSGMETAVSTFRMILFAVLILLGIGILSNLGMTFGDWLEGQLSGFAFVGRFLALTFEAFLVLSPGIVGLLLGLVAMSMGSKYGQEGVLRVSGMPARILTAVTSAVGTAVFIFGVGQSLNWLYQYDEPQLWTTYPAIVGGVIMLVVGYLVEPKRPFPIGSVIYTITRGILNIIRSIEPLIYVIVFAVWVGIGPFAGILALTGHTIAALGKLFSEQVENISEGPLEAITATGANRLQTIVFGVVPQVVPPYIAFTLYRWDINVRFSTVIGFGGGGGIGFVLVQNINLLKYRQASVMMIAIAIVVISLDFISSKIRTRII
ncbi:MAG: ABC transporter permease subunit [Chloroflexi bacterium]|nr:ABC transporter permease subunit [Chloroflexota bacterium]